MRNDKKFTNFLILKGIGVWEVMFSPPNMFFFWLLEPVSCLLFVYFTM